MGPGEPITGEIEIAGDSDWAAVSLEAGKVYVVGVLADGDGAVDLTRLNPASVR